MKYKLFLYLLLSVFPLSAQSPERVRDLEKERKAALVEIEETNRLLLENKLTTSNALNRLNLLVQQINSRKKIIQLLNQEITSLNEKISVKEGQIKKLEKDLDVKKERYAVSLQKMYSHKNGQDYLLFIFSSQNFTQSFHRIKYLKEYSIWQKKQAVEIAERQSLINEEKNNLLADRTTKMSFLKDRQFEENQLSKEEVTKKAEVKSLEKNKKKLQEELAKKEKQAEALNLQTQRIIAEEILRSKVESGESRTAEIRGGYAMTEGEKNLSSNFAGNKGKLPFPLTGSYTVVGYFGVHQHKELSHVEVKNNGIDIETTSGNEARVVFDGVVSRIFTLPGYNNSIIVRHGNYLTLYSNIDRVYVKQGDKVNTGQPIGKIYTDKEKGNSTLLHFEVWKEQIKLDPLPWIRK